MYDTEVILFSIGKKYNNYNMLYVYCRGSNQAPVFFLPLLNLQINVNLCIKSNGIFSHGLLTLGVY